MKSWWEGLPRRERMWITLGVAVVLAALAWAYVWQPLDAARDRERTRVAQQQALLQWLQAVDPVARELKRTVPPAADLDGRSLLGLVDETARAGGLAGALQRIEPAGEGQVRVWFEEADFAAVMDWLERLAGGYPVTIEQLGADRSDRAGRVNVRLTIAQLDNEG